MNIKNPVHLVDVKMPRVRDSQYR